MVAIVGAVTVTIGLLVLTRPLTSLWLLTVYIAVSAILSGVAELLTHRATPHWPRRIIATVWFALGAVILIGFGRTLDMLPSVLALLLFLGAIVSVSDALTRGALSERVLSAVWGAAQIVFGILALTWPDITAIVVAVVFGVRTTIFGIILVWRGLRALVTPRGVGSAFGASAIDSTPSRPARAWLATGRYALAAVLIVVASGGWWINGWLAEGTPVVDAFYDPPDVVPYEHGRLIRSDVFLGQHPSGADVTRILYTTRDALGQPAVASALVIVPENFPLGHRPVIAWNHGTTGVARDCAPSLRDASATHWAIPALNDAIERGWVVVATDYSGQGAPGVFPYLIGRGEARSSLDAVVAARELEGLRLSSRTVAWGHSQGGHAALWMTQIAEDYAPELDIRGTALLAPVSDPLALADEMASGEGDAVLSILTAWVLVPYADTYPDVDLSRYVTPGAEPIVREMTQRCVDEPGLVVSVATAIGVSEDRPLFLGDLSEGPLGDHLADNAPSGPSNSPILVAWGDADEVIPPRLQDEFVRDLCAQGDRVRWAIYAGYDHRGTLVPASRFLGLLTNWTDTVLTGSGIPLDDCHR